MSKCWQGYSRICQLKIQNLPTIIEKEEGEEGLESGSSTQPAASAHNVDEKPEGELQWRIRASVQSLSEVDLAYLVLESPAKLAVTRPQSNTHLITPSQPQCTNLLDLIPKTCNKCLLQTTLKDAKCWAEK